MCPAGTKSENWGKDPPRRTSGTWQGKEERAKVRREHRLRILAGNVAQLVVIGEACLAREGKGTGLGS